MDVAMTRLANHHNNRIVMPLKEDNIAHTLGELDDYDDETNYVDDEVDAEMEKRRDRRRQEDYNG